MRAVDFYDCSMCSMCVTTSAFSRALFAGHSYIGTEHILLGLLREGEGIAARVLEALGANPEKIRNQVCLPRNRAENSRLVAASSPSAPASAVP